MDKVGYLKLKLVLVNDLLWLNYQCKRHHKLLTVFMVNSRSLKWHTFFV